MFWHRSVVVAGFIFLGSGGGGGGVYGFTSSYLDNLDSSKPQQIDTPPPQNINTNVNEQQLKNIPTFMDYNNENPKNTNDVNVGGVIREHQQPQPQPRFFPAPSTPSTTPVYRNTAAMMMKNTNTPTNKYNYENGIMQYGANNAYKTRTSYKVELSKANCHNSNGIMEYNDNHKFKDTSRNFYKVLIDKPSTTSVTTSAAPTTPTTTMSTCKLENGIMAYGENNKFKSRRNLYQVLQGPPPQPPPISSTSTSPPTTTTMMAAAPSKNNFFPSPTSTSTTSTCQLENGIMAYGENNKFKSRTSYKVETTNTNCHDENGVMAYNENNSFKRRTSYKVEPSPKKSQLQNGIMEYEENKYFQA